MSRRIDLKGQEIWDVIIDGLRSRGLEMVRGSGNLIHRRMGDGQWHVECEVVDSRSGAMDEQGAAS